MIFRSGKGTLTSNLANYLKGNNHVISLDHYFQVNSCNWIYTIQWGNCDHIEQPAAINWKRFEDDILAAKKKLEVSMQHLDIIYEI